MSRELIQLDARKRPTRISLILLITVATLWSFYAVRWYVGNTMAEYFNTDENNLDLAKTAVTLAPNDRFDSLDIGTSIAKGHASRSNECLFTRIREGGESVTG